jgi:hypothetical protein
MADMCGLVRIDGRMFDDRFAVAMAGHRRRRGHSLQSGRPPGRDERSGTRSAPA